MSFRRTTSRSSTAPRRSAHLLLALTLGAGVVAATPVAAQARTVTNPDEVKDMVRVDQETGDFKRAPRYRMNDVTSTQLTHTANKVGVELSLARLKKVGQQVWFVSITPSKGDAREVTLQAGAGNWSGVLAVRDSETGEEVSCGRHDIDYEDDVVSIALPRDCVGKGRWVRFRVGAVSYTSGNSYGDDALRDRPLKDSDNNWAPSGRVYR